jgi:hypothetical protein
VVSRLVPDAFAVFSPVKPEEVVLGRYTFVPHYRSGIAASLTRPFATTEPIRAQVRMTIAVESASGSDDAEVKLTVRGPADVAAIEGEIIRRYPEPGTPNAEPSDMAHVEFDSPDLPWQFTPTGPDGAGHLPPWLRLVVVNAAVAKVAPPTANSLAVLTTPASELPPADQAWAWAHAQVLGQKAGDPSLAQRLSPATPTANLSRIIAPRQLPAYQDWIACLVPTFKAGAEAGLGGTVSTNNLAFSWSGTVGQVTLPVYHYWTFSTGPNGDFETLAERLTPVRPTGNVGIRITDASHPGNGMNAVPAAGTGRRREVRGALTRPGIAETDGARWPDATTDELRAQLNTPAKEQFGDGPVSDDPTIAPPIYAGAHTARNQVPGQPPWFVDVNSDPADRVVAGLGARVVQMDQEQLMASAWAQVAGVEETNRALRAAQFGRYVAESMHRRHLKRLRAADLLAVTDRVSSRLLDGSGLTVRTRIDNSVLPTAVTAGITRRLLAPRGRYTRFAVADGVSPQQSRVDAVRALLADDDGEATNWVRRYTDPDGVTSLADATAAEVDVDVDAVNEGLAHDGVAELLIAAAKAGVLGDVLAQIPDLPRVLLSGLLDRLLGALPTPREIDLDPSAADAAPDTVGQILAVVAVSDNRGIDEWTIFETTSRRIGFGDPVGDGTALIRRAEVMDLLRHIAARCEDVGVSVPLESDDHTRTAIEDTLRTANTETLVDGFTGVAKTAVRPGGIRDIDRDGFVVDDLGLTTKLNPRATITRRVLARLPAKTKWPLWLPKDWFDDGRAEQVMAAPTFPHPLYEALDRYDREWLMPGVAALKPHELVTLLATNARFVEAFLVGANHEFARELIWRGYPSDGRGTSFFSFWTPAAELQKPLHAFGGGTLGSHLDPALRGAIVLLVRGELVRRYPNVLADVVTQLADGDPPQKFSADTTKQLFRLQLAPDMLLVGFRLSYEAIASPPVGKKGASWFTLSEHVGEPRFGFDEPGGAVANPPTRDDLRWGDMATDERKFLLAAPPRINVGPFRPDADHFAWLSFQQPARVAFAALEMMNKIR